MSLQSSRPPRLVLLNLYGDDKTYKPVPELNDPVRADGLVLALRERTTEATPQSLREIDYLNDRLFYVTPSTTTH